MPVNNTTKPNSSITSIRSSHCSVSGRVNTKRPVIIPTRPIMIKVRIPISLARSASLCSKTKPLDIQNPPIKLANSGKDLSGIKISKIPKVMAANPRNAANRKGIFCKIRRLFLQSVRLISFINNHCVIRSVTTRVGCEAVTKSTLRPTIGKPGFVFQKIREQAFTSCARIMTTTDMKARRLTNLEFIFIFITSIVVSTLNQI